MVLVRCRAPQSASGPCDDAGLEDLRLLPRAGRSQVRSRPYSRRAHLAHPDHRYLLRGHHLVPAVLVSDCQ